MSDFIGVTNTHAKDNDSVEDSRIDSNDAPSKNDNSKPELDNVPTKNDGALTITTLGVSIPVTFFILVIMISVILAAKR